MKWFKENSIFVWTLLIAIEVIVFGDCKAGTLLIKGALLVVCYAFVSLLSNSMLIKKYVLGQK